MPNSFSGIGGWEAIDADWRDSKTGIASSITNLNNSIADEFSTLSSYISGNVVMHNNNRYVCIASTAGPGDWDENNWEARTIQQDLGSGGGGGSDAPFSTAIAPIFSTSGTYAVGDAVMYNGKRYVSNEAQTMVAWDSTKWTEKSVEDEIGNIETLLAAL